MSPAGRPPKRRSVAWVAAGLIAFFPALSFSTIGSLAHGQGLAIEDDHELKNPYREDPQAIKEGERLFIRLCTGCHWTSRRGPEIFKTKLGYEKFLEVTISGRKTLRTMPPFGRLLSPDDVAKIYALLQSRERLR